MGLEKDGIRDVNKNYGVRETNGKYGAINPLPYIENASALQAAGLIRQIGEMTAKVAQFIADYIRK